MSPPTAVHPLLASNSQSVLLVSSDQVVRGTSYVLKANHTVGCECVTSLGGISTCLSGKQQISRSRLWSISLLPTSCQAKGSMALSCVMVAFNFALKIGRAGTST